MGDRNVGVEIKETTPILNLCLSRFLNIQDFGR